MFNEKDISLFRILIEHWIQENSNEPITVSQHNDANTCFSYFSICLSDQDYFTISLKDFPHELKKYMISDGFCV